MDAADDPIRALLEKTGLSCDDLLQKLMIFKSQEKNKNEECANHDGVSSGKNGDSSVNGACQFDIAESSKRKNDGEYHQNGDHLSVVDSSDIHYSTEENCSESLPSDILYKKNNVNTANIVENSSINISDDFENTLLENLDCSTNSEENIEKIAETKEICHKTSDSDNKPKKTVEEIPHTITLPNNTSTLQNETASVELEENITIENAENGISLNNSSQSSEEECFDENEKKESRVESTYLAPSAEILPSSNLKVVDLPNEINKQNSAFISTKRKSISDQLVRRLVQRVNEDDITKLEDEQVKEESKVDKISENVRDVDCLQTKDIEQVPFLKLRNDLFSNDDRKSPANSLTCHNSSEEVQLSQDYVSEEVNNLSEMNTTEEISEVNSFETGFFSFIQKIRKIKVGFLKKKILSKAIKHLSSVDSIKHKRKQCKETPITNSETDIDYSFQRPLPKLISESQVDTPEAQEEIRKNLKLQLNSLRNRKKSGSITDRGQCYKSQSISDLKINYKKQLLNKEVRNSSTPSQSVSTINAACTDIDESLVCPSGKETEHLENSLEVSKSNVESLFSLSEETNFMIVDVQGGVEFPENLNVNIENDDGQNDSIKLTKTNDITKIKGWKNKKFDMAIGRSNSEKRATENCLEEMNRGDTILATSPRKDDSNSTEILKKDENSTGELSPFVSNTLEEFLTENSKLNISYKIPKLGAEEGLRELNFKDVVLPKSQKLPQTHEINRKDRIKGIKAKTLAEKRRILEGRVSKDCCANEADPLNISKSSYIYFNGLKLFVPSTSCNKCLGNIKFKPSKPIKPNRLIYKSDNTENEANMPKKLSLLKLWLEESKLVTYKPGPLSKKRKLQNSETISSWDTVVQKLPKVQLEIIHEFGKKIPPSLVPFLPKPGTIIKSDYLEFALSAVHTKSAKHSKQGFRFSIPYKNNQKYILMGRSKEESQDTIVCDIEPERNSVASVIDDLIKYVEIKELGDSIIKDAEPYVEEECEVGLQTHMRNDNVVEDNIAKKSIKRRKLEMELQRLSCKVVSVTVEDKEIMNNDCNKLYCKLGCICRSLKSLSHLPFNYQHCIKKECMFECKCSAINGDVTLSSDISLLSSDTVTRIEDQAKRNLARVEKEFTQTIIHANDKTILIPSSDRNKTKRPKRAPKRYSDFLENHDFVQENAILSKENQKSKVLQNFELFSSFVKLEKLDIKSVVPLCLDHNCYNCYCLKNIAPLDQNRNKSNNEENVEENVPLKKLKKLKVHDDETKNSQSNTNIKNHSSSDPENDNVVNFVSKGCDGCARIRAVHPEIAARNEIPYYKNKLRRRVENDEYQHKCCPPINMRYQEKQSHIIDVKTPLTILASDRLKYFMNQRKRKQVHQVRDDFETAPPSGKVKKIKKQHKSVHACSSEPIKEDTKSELPYATIFDGEIVIPTNANKDFVRNLGVKSVAPYMRLLPWNDLLNNYYSMKINIWCSSEKSDKLLINRSHVKPPEGYIDIKKSNRTNGIMTWILLKELPKKTPPELVHLILSPNKNHFEISGICLKNIPSSQEREQIEKVNDQNYNENKDDHIEEIQEIRTENANTEKPDNRDSNFLEHKNHKNELSVLSLTKHEFFPQYFYLAEICDIVNEKFPLAIELPITRIECRWRMLYLNSNFSFLSFISNKYSIKYTDLKHILKKAQNTNKTICLKSEQLSSGYTHKKFGIYAVPKYRDRLFIGPYDLKEEHGLETLRYLRKSLVTTSYFETIQGIANSGNKNALWLSNKRTNITDSNQLSLLRRPSQRSLLKCNVKNNVNNSSRENEDLAELTPILNLNSPISNSRSSMDDATLSELRSNSFSETNKQTDQRIELQGIHEHSKLLEGSDTFISSTDLEDKPFIKFPEFTLLNEKKLKPEDYNRFIMTNIPHFGYLGANQTEQSKAIYVNWPFGDKTLMFPTVSAAIEFLRRRFTNLLLPIPATFQLNFIILRRIQASHHSPINAKILNGTHICGEFGVIDSRKLTSTLAKSLGTTQDDVLKRLAKRAHYLVRCRLRTLGLFLLPKDEKLGEVLDNVAYVTNLGTLEIAKLKEQEKKLIQIKKDLILRKQNNLTKFMELLMHLPDKQRLKEYDKFRHQFNGRGKQNNAETNKLPNDEKKQERMECIEIEDSDSENETSDNISRTTNVSRPLQSSPLPENHVTVKSHSSEFDQTSSGNNPKSYKFITSASGKLVLVKNNSGGSFSTSLSGMKMTIRNNQVIWRNRNVDGNSDIQAVEDTSNHDNNSDVDEVVKKNSEGDSVVTLDESDESDIEILE